MTAAAGRRLSAMVATCMLAASWVLPGGKEQQTGAICMRSGSACSRPGWVQQPVRCPVHVQEASEHRCRVVVPPFIAAQNFVSNRLSYTTAAPQVMPPCAAYLMTSETCSGFPVHWRSRLEAASLLSCAACDMARVLRASSRDMNCG